MQYPTDTDIDTESLMETKYKHGSRKRPLALLFDRGLFLQCDRMAVECGQELKKNNVAMVSLWPGPVKTETIMASLTDAKNPPKLESKAVVRLHASLSACQSVLLPAVCVSACLPAHTVIPPSVRLSLPVPLYTYTVCSCLPVCQSDSLSACWPVCLPLCLSV